MYRVHDLEEAVSALIYTLTAKDNKIWANIQLTLLQINLETALGKFDSIKRFCQFVWKQFLFCSVSGVTLYCHCTNLNGFDKLFKRLENSSVDIDIDIDISL